MIKRPGYEDHLFIPFTDLTNGDETYEVGRYIEFRIPESANVIVDFNQCYNPYCSYSPELFMPDSTRGQPSDYRYSGGREEVQNSALAGPRT